MAAHRTKRRTLVSSWDYYEAFHRAADRGNYRKAFAVFKANPLLIHHLKLSEIPTHCRYMSVQVSKRDVYEFIEAVNEDLDNLGQMLKAAKKYDKQIRKEFRSYSRKQGIRNPNLRVIRHWQSSGSLAKHGRIDVTRLR